jgi:RNA polymerase sigma-70 factor (ECF subfamily)
MMMQLVQCRREVWVADVPSPPSDEELAGRLQAGDPAALRALMERYQRPLYGYLCRMLGSPQDAEDVFQEAFLRVLRAIGRFDTGRRFRPWLYAIATNLVRNTYRSRGYRDALTLDAADEEGAPLAARLAGRAPRPSDALESQERASIVAEAVSGLPEKGRTALVLYYYQGLSYQEVSQALEVPLGTVKSRIHNAMARLDQALARREEEVR